MNDQGHPEHEPGFDDPAYDDLRALLADARVTDPVPADVAARLDETLAALTADRRAEPVPDEAPANVVPLRRRGRVGSRLLAAAAAVIVVGAGGVGISQVLSTQDAADMATAESAPEPASGDDFGPVAPDSPESAGPQAQDRDGLVDLTERLADSGVVPRFSSAGFAEEAAAFRSTKLVLNNLDAPSRTPVADEGTEGGSATSGGAGSAPQPGSPGDTPTDSSGERSSYFAAKAACPGPVGIAAALVPIRFDGQPAALAVYPPSADGRRFEAWSCDGRTMLASTVVPR